MINTFCTLIHYPHSVSMDSHLHDRNVKKTFNPRAGSIDSGPLNLANQFRDMVVLPPGHFTNEIPRSFST